MKQMARKQYFVKAHVIYGCIDNVLVYLELFLAGMQELKVPHCPHCRLITQDSELQELKTSVDHLTKELTSLKATIAVIGKSNSDLHSSSQLRQQSIQQQATQYIVKQDTQTPTSAQASANSRGSIAAKNTDKRYEEDRKFNVVIHGIEKCCKGTPKYERFKHDLKEVTSVITNTESSISHLSIQDHLRLGKYRENSKKPRPVLVKFNRATDRSLLLSNLRTITLPGNIKITPDLSVEEELLDHCS